MIWPLTPKPMSIGGSTPHPQPLSLKGRGERCESLRNYIGT
jgi:hypothetical protein